MNSETVVERVWSVAFITGLLFGQMTQIPIFDIVDILYEDYNVIYEYIMYLKITKPKINGQSFTAILYDDEKIPIKTVHFGAHGYDDYTVPPHDADKKARYIQRQA